MCRTKNLSNPNRLSILQAYRRNPDASLRELVQTVGIPLTTVNHHLNNLENEGVITRSDKRRGPKSASGQRKWVSPETIEKKRQGAANGRSANVFVPRPKKQVVAEHLTECFERAVALGKANDAKIENMQDVIRDNRWSMNHHVRVHNRG